MVLVQPHIKLSICFNYTHLSTLIDKDTPPCYTQSFYISLRLNRSPPLRPNIFIPHLLNQAVKISGDRLNAGRSKTTFSVSHLWLQKCFGNIMLFNSHLLRGIRGRTFYFQDEVQDY